MERLVSSREVARITGLSRSQINRDAAAGKLPSAAKLEGGARLFRLDDVEATYRIVVEA